MSNYNVGLTPHHTRVAEYDVGTSDDESDEGKYVLPTVTGNDTTKPMGTKRPEMFINTKKFFSGVFKKYFGPKVAAGHHATTIIHEPVPEQGSAANRAQKTAVQAGLVSSTPANENEIAFSTQKETLTRRPRSESRVPPECTVALPEYASYSYSDSESDSPQTEKAGPAPKPSSLPFADVDTISVTSYRSMTPSSVRSITPHSDRSITPPSDRSSHAAGQAAEVLSIRNSLLNPRIATAMKTAINKVVKGQIRIDAAPFIAFNRLPMPAGIDLYIGNDELPDILADSPELNVDQINLKLSNSYKERSAYLEAPVPPQEKLRAMPSLIISLNSTPDGLPKYEESIEREGFTHIQFPILVNEKGYRDIIDGERSVELAQLFHKIDKAINNKEGVFIHCPLGDDHSAAMWVLYLAMRIVEEDAKQAHRFVFKGRPAIKSLDGVDFPGTPKRNSFMTNVNDFMENTNEDKSA